jgi:hypothetical protein
MSFLNRRHGDQFREGWASLNEADWYTACAGCTIDDGENEAEPMLSGMTSHTAIAHIPWEVQFTEADEIHKALSAWGISGADYFDLTDISMQSTLTKLDQLAEKCGGEGFDCVELEDDDENELTPVILSSSNPNQLAAFKLAIELMGVI